MCYRLENVGFTHNFFLGECFLVLKVDLFIRGLGHTLGKCFFLQFHLKVI